LWDLVAGIFDLGNYGSSSSLSSPTTKQFMSTITKELRSINNTLNLLNTSINQMNNNVNQLNINEIN
jgi:hypothetical protein